jgi:hypothetical protein
LQMCVAPCGGKLIGSTSEQFALCRLVVSFFTQDF